jgi:hypothetical protein
MAEQAGSNQASPLATVPPHDSLTKGKLVALGPQPPETLWERLTRRRKSRAKPPSLGRWLAKYAVPLIAVEVALFGGTAAETNDPGQALQVALGRTGPFVLHADWFAVPLAVWSWLLIPALVAAIVAYLMDRSLKIRTEAAVRSAIADRMRRVRQGTPQSAGEGTSDHDV